MPCRAWLRCSVVFATIAVGGLGCSTKPSPAPPALLIRDVMILSMDDEAPRRGSVLVRGDRIEYVGPTDALPLAPNARVVDGRGRFLIPGLIDMHTHVSKTRGSSLSLLVSAGVTTVRDLGGDHEELLAWRREIDAGARVGPRMLIAGPISNRRATPRANTRHPSARWSSPPSAHGSASPRRRMPSASSRGSMRAVSTT